MHHRVHFVHFLGRLLLMMGILPITLLIWGLLVGGGALLLAGLYTAVRNRFAKPATGAAAVADDGSPLAKPATGFAAQIRSGRPAALLGCLLTACGLWLQYRPDLSSAERAELFIERLDGVITRDLADPSKPITAVSFHHFRMGMDLTGPTILTDAQLAGLQPHLEALDKLRYLNLVDTDVTDAGLTSLTTLKQLSVLRLGRREWSAKAKSPTGEAVERLKLALPNTKVEFCEQFDPRPLFRLAR